MKINKIIYDSGYKYGYKQLEKKHKYKVLNELEEVLYKLVNLEISSSNSNHPLTGNLKGYKDIHLAGGDIVLLYKYEYDNLYIDLILHDLGPHDDVSYKNPKTNKKKFKEELENEIS